MQHEKETFSLRSFIKENKKAQKRSNLRKRNYNIDQKKFKGNKIYVPENSRNNIHKRIKEVLDLEEENPESKTTAELNQLITKEDTEDKIQEFIDYFNVAELNEAELQEFYQKSHLESNFYPRSFAIINYKKSNLSVSVDIHQDVIGDLRKISLKVFSSNHFDLANCVSHGGSLNALIEMIYQAKQSKSSVVNKSSKARREYNFFSKKLKLQASIKSTYELCQPILVNGKYNS